MHGPHLFRQLVLVVLLLLSILDPQPVGRWPSAAPTSFSVNAKHVSVLALTRRMWGDGRVANSSRMGGHQRQLGIGLLTGVEAMLRNGTTTDDGRGNCTGLWDHTGALASTTEKNVKFGFELRILMDMD